MPQAHGTPFSLSAATSSAVKIAATPGLASASVFSIATMTEDGIGVRFAAGKKLVA
jgi:acid phosphatase family membrane protein YuiD